MAVDAVGTSYRWWILVTTTSTLDSTLAARYGTMDVVAAMGTSSSGKVESGMISAFP
jgi:hypothetical protein